MQVAPLKCRALAMHARASVGAAETRSPALTQIWSDVAPMAQHNTTRRNLDVANNQEKAGGLLARAKLRARAKPHVLRYRVLQRTYTPSFPRMLTQCQFLLSENPTRPMHLSPRNKAQLQGPDNYGPTVTSKRTSKCPNFLDIERHPRAKPTLPVT